MPTRPRASWASGGANRREPYREHVLNGPVPPWHSQWEIWRRQYEAAFRAGGLEGDSTRAADDVRAALSLAAPYDDAHPAVEELAGAGFTIGLLSNADEDFLQRALSRARLRFSVIQSSESLRIYKPHRAVFLAACERLGCAPAETLYVGDSPIADVGGAHNAGLRTVLDQPLAPQSAGGSGRSAGAGRGGRARGADEPAPRARRDGPLAVRTRARPERSSLAADGRGRSGRLPGRTRSGPLPGARCRGRGRCTANGRRYWPKGARGPILVANTVNLRMQLTKRS